MFAHPGAIALKHSTVWHQNYPIYGQKEKFFSPNCHVQWGFLIFRSHIGIIEQRKHNSNSRFPQGPLRFQNPLLLYISEHEPSPMKLSATTLPSPPCPMNMYKEKKRHKWNLDWWNITTMWLTFHKGKGKRQTGKSGNMQSKISYRK